MRIALKILAIVVTLVIMVLAVEALLRSQREAALYEQDLRRDQRILGRALREVAELTWEERGLDDAARMIEAAAAGEREVAVRLLYDDEIEAVLADLRANPSLEVLPDEDLLQFTRDDQSGALVTVVPLDGPGERRVGLELATPSAHEQAYLARGMRRFAIISGLLIFAAGVLAAAAGGVWIGRPLDALGAQTRAFARGEFVHSSLRTDDEIGELGRALDRTADQLAKARADLEHETRERIAALEHLRHADRLATVGTLAAGVAHELGTPLHVIAGRAQRIARGTDAITDAKIIVEQCEHVQEIVRGLLDFARPRERERVQVRLPELLARTVAMIEPLLRRHHAQVEIGVEPGAVEPGLLLAAPGQLQQVFINLLVNAAQAMGESGGEVWVCVAGHLPNPDPQSEIASAESYARVRVVDQGRGIDPETLEQIYDPFFTTKEPGEGTGLGLSIAYGIVHDHGGWIRASNVSEGQGAVFEVWLPEQPSERAPHESHEPSESSQASERDGPDRPHEEAQT